MVRPRAASLVVALTVLTLVRLGMADQEPVLLTYDALDGCPARAEFVRQVEGRTPRAGWVTEAPGARRFVVVIAGSLAQPRGALTVLSDEGAATRVVQGETCEEVVAALALITAVAIDPQAKLVVPEPVPAPPTPAPVPAEPPPGADPSAGTPAPGPTGPLPAPVWPPPASAEPPPVEPEPPPGPPWPSSGPGPDRDVPGPQPRGWRWTLGLGAAAASGLDTLGLQVPVFLDLERAESAFWSPAFRATVVVTPTQEVGHARGVADFRRYAGALSGCPLRWQLHPTLGLRPCLAVEAGALLARGKVDQGLESTTGWVAILLPARLQWSPSTWALLEVQGAFGVPLVQPRFYFEPDTTVVTYDPVLGTIGGNVGVRFP